MARKRIRVSKKQSKEKTQEAITWFLMKARKLGSKKAGFAGRASIMPNDMFIGRRTTKKPLIGQVVFFRYDAKHKATLPYWDMFPLAIILDVKEDRFLSLNLHYLRPDLRFILLSRMIETVTDNSLDHRSKAKINYGLVRSAAKFRIAKPAIKSHLLSHIKSKVIRIPAREWDMVGWLPLEVFVGASKEAVWADSSKR